MTRRCGKDYRARRVGFVHVHVAIDAAISRRDRSSRYSTISQSRLQRTRRSRVLAMPVGTGGSDPDYLDELLHYWRDEYDWRAQERELNRLRTSWRTSMMRSVHYVHETGLQRALHAVVAAAWLAGFVPALSDRDSTAHRCGAMTTRMSRYLRRGRAVAAGLRFHRAGAAVRAGSERQAFGAPAASAHDRSARIPAIRRRGR